MMSTRETVCLPHLPLTTLISWTITTKDNLTFFQLKVRMYSLFSNIGSAGSALVVNHGKRSHRSDKKRKRDQSQTPTTTAKSCTWCKAQIFRYEGHTWQECKKLKASKSGSAYVTQDSAAPAVGTSVPSTPASALVADTQAQSFNLC